MEWAYKTTTTPTAAGIPTSPKTKIFETTNLNAFQKKSLNIVEPIHPDGKPDFRTDYVHLGTYFRFLILFLIILIISPMIQYINWKIQKQKDLLTLTTTSWLKKNHENNPENGFRQKWESGKIWNNKQDPTITCLPGSHAAGFDLGVLSSRVRERSAKVAGRPVGGARASAATSAAAAAPATVAARLRAAPLQHPAAPEPSSKRQERTRATTPSCSYERAFGKCRRKCFTRRRPMADGRRILRFFDAVIRAQT